MEARTDLDALLAHAGWASALARSLTRDQHAADDLVQRAWLAALERRPRDDDPTPIRRWLAAVMRNLVRQDVRDADRRVQRERSVARRECDGNGSGTGESFALQRRLLDAIERLDDIDRGLIWSRYFEGLPPRAIAQRDGVPVPRVKKQLARALERLRERLDREHGGDRRAWLAAFAPLLDLRGPQAATLGVLLVDTKVKLGLLAAAVVAVVVWTRVGTSPATDVRGAQREDEPQELAKAEQRSSEPLDAPATARTAQEAEPVASARASAASTSIAAAHTLRGSVLDLDGHGVGELEIVERSLPNDHALDGKVLATTATDGTFEIVGPPPANEVAARGADWTTVFSARLWHEDVDLDATIYVARRRTLAGVVVDPSRNPIPGAEVRWLASNSLRRDLGAVLDHTVATEWKVVTDALGHFALEDAPLAPGKLHVEAVGFSARDVETPSVPTWDMTIALGALDAEHIVLAGHVLDAARKPVSDARVALGPQSIVTHDDGAFAFDISDVREGGTAVRNSDGVFVPKYSSSAIVAVKAGNLPARFELPPADQLRELARRASIDLVLDGEPLEIRGRVVDADDHAIAGAVVSADDETPFGMIYADVGNEKYGLDATIEHLLRGGFSAREPATDASGTFVLGGLLDREYRVSVLDKRTMRREISAPVRAGSRDVTIRLPGESSCVKVAGRVAAADGTAIAGAHVVLGCAPSATEPPTFGTSVETDADGRFEFPKVRPDGLVLQISHPSIVLIVDWRPSAADELDKLAILAVRRCHVQVDLGARTDYATSFAVFDAKGEPVKMLLVHGAITWLPERIDIVDGKSEAAAIEENGVTIAFYKGEAEVERMPLALKPGELVTVRP